VNVSLLHPHRQFGLATRSFIISRRRPKRRASHDTSQKYSNHTRSMNLLTRMPILLAVIDRAPVKRRGMYCVYVCQTITFESLDVGSSYLHMQYISTGRVHHRGQKARKFLFTQCKTSIGNNSRVVMFASGIWFSGTADRMV